jgi:ABC-type uncharacterized transport system permease subunit
LLDPLMILSGRLLPLEAGPGWMRFLAAFNPLAYLVDADRALFGCRVTADVGWGWLAAIVTAAVGLTIGVREWSAAQTKFAGRGAGFTCVVPHPAPLVGGHNDPAQSRR